MFMSSFVSLLDSITKMFFSSFVTLCEHVDFYLHTNGYLNMFLCVCVYILLAYGSSWLGVYVNVCMHIIEWDLEITTILFALSMGCKIGFNI